MASSQLSILLAHSRHLSCICYLHTKTTFIGSQMHNLQDTFHNQAYFDARKLYYSSHATGRDLLHICYIAQLSCLFTYLLQTSTTQSYAKYRPSCRVKYFVRAIRVRYLWLSTTALRKPDTAVSCWASLLLPLLLLCRGSYHLVDYGSSVQYLWFPTW